MISLSASILVGAEHVGEVCADPCEWAFVAAGTWHVRVWSRDFDPRLSALCWCRL
jgi:hypothetical protein